MKNIDGVYAFYFFLFFFGICMVSNIFCLGGEQDWYWDGVMDVPTTGQIWRFVLMTRTREIDQTHKTFMIYTNH